MPDHVHMLLAIPPKYSVSSVMGYLKGKALEDGDKRLAASYAHLEEAERIARSGKLPDRESVLLSPDIAFICLHAGVSSSQSSSMPSKSPQVPVGSSSISV